MAELEYAMNHVFLPPKLPQEHDSGPQASLGDIALCRFAYEAAVEFPQHLAAYHQTHWAVVIKMLENLLDTTRFFGKEYHVSKIVKLRVGGQPFSSLEVFKWLTYPCYCVIQKPLRSTFAHKMLAFYCAKILRPLFLRPSRCHRLLKPS